MGLKRCASEPTRQSRRGAKFLPSGGGIALDTMAQLHDVTHYILTEMGDMSAMKLQKLTYYCHAWSLAWDEVPLTEARIEAWAGGPVIPELYNRHRGMFRVGVGIASDGDGARLLPDERETVDRVLEFYGSRSAQWLSDLTHLEEPWIKARGRARVGIGEACNEQITDADMAEYYTGLESNDTSEAVA